ncbi:hypothetical protein Tco_0558225 [Tanacetum coccineum]
MATLIDFSKYAMNRLKIENFTQAQLVGLVYEMLKGTCTSSIKLEYNMEECFNALTYKIDWNNPEGVRCPFDLTKPLLLKGRPGRLTVAAGYFFNNDLEFLKSSDPEKKYTMSIAKTKATRYEIIMESIIYGQTIDKYRSRGGEKAQIIRNPSEKIGGCTREIEL